MIDMYSTINQMRLEHKTIFDIPLRVTYYARVSSKTDAQQNSIVNQIGHFENFIKSNSNWTFVKGYVDEIRGESAVNRVSFLRMIEDAKLDCFDLIITKEVSRFARDTLDSLVYTRELLHMGVGVFFQSDNICTIEQDSELRLIIMSGIAQDEVRKLSERIKFGHKRAIENGVVLGNSRIFGYNKDKGKLVINDKEAEMVRLIFNLYVEGKYSSRAIQKILFEKGYRGRNGNEISHTTINSIIQNPKYKGYYTGNKVKITNYRTKEQRFLPKSEWKMYKDETGEIVPAIVSEELWEKANIIFEKRSMEVKEKKHSIKTKNIFTGKIWCVGHDKPYWRTSYTKANSKNQGNIYQWICSEKKNKSYDACASIAIYETELYEIIKKYFIDIIDDIDSYINEFIDIYKATDIKEKIKEDIDKLQNDIQRLEEKKEMLLDLYMDKKIDKIEFQKRNDRYNNDISDLSEELRIIEKSQVSNEDYIKQLNKIKRLFKEVFNDNFDVNTMTNEHVDEIARVLIKRIEVTPIDKSSMKMTVILNTGECNDIKYQRLSTRRSGHTIKKMIQAYETSIK